MIDLMKASDILNKESLEEGLEKYLYIKENFNKVDVSENTDFQNMYRDFYGMRPFYDDDFCKKYFRIMQKLKSEENITFSLILERIEKIKGSYEISYASKMLHTLDNKSPIWDRIVTTNHFKIRAPYYKAKNKLEACIEKYDKYCTCFEDYMRSEEGKKLIDMFDKKFPNNNITNAKKIDFILWQDR